jgi:acetyl-CoA acetyltransferase
MTRSPSPPASRPRCWGWHPGGQGYRLWKDGDAAPGGRLPINTNGGGLSFNHSGMYGIQLLVEAYRQLSGTCVVNGTGGSLSTTGTLVLAADAFVR